jgi:signal transduction histidine kinase
MPDPADVERRQQELTFLAEVAHALATTEALDVILPLIVDRVSLLLDCEAVAVVGVAPERQEITVLAAQTSVPGGEGLRGRTYPRPGTIIDRALAERAPLRIVPDGPASLDPIVQALLGGRRPRSGLILQLRVAGAERGALVVVDPATPAGPEEVRTLIAFADQAAVALDRAQLRRHRSDDATRLKVLNAVLQVTSAGFEEETLIRRAMAALLGASPADRAELFTNDGAELRLRFAHGPESTPDGGPGIDARRRELHETVAERGEPVVRQGAWSLRPGAEPYVICVPLRARDRILGTLLLARRSAPFDDQELEMLTAVGDHLGVAIELSRLFRRVAMEAEQLERVAAERSVALKEAQEQLSRSQWLASLGELAAGVAHDLNNALNPVVAFAELIKEHSDQPDRVRLYAERILMAAQGGAETVRRIQRFTRRRLGSLPFEPLSVAELVREAIELTRPNWAQRMTGGPITVEESVDPELLVQGNAGELRQALLNLIGNAIDAMPAGGTLRFVGRAEGASVVLAVQDTGTGMPKEVYEKALEPFFTTKGAHGTGLGLAEVFGIARRHGGDLELLSWSGVGTTVILRLPRAETPREPTKARRRLTGSAANVHHILLVDDNLLSLEATAASLRAAGHTVATAANAQTALRIFNAGHFDLVLSDLGLPDLNGWELVDRIRVRDPKIRVGLITGWSIPEGDELLKRHGIDMVFVKPVDPDQLLAAL